MTLWLIFLRTQLGKITYTLPRGNYRSPTSFLYPSGSQSCRISPEMRNSKKARTQISRRDLLKGVVTAGAGILAGCANPALTDGSREKTRSRPEAVRLENQLPG